MNGGQNFPYQKTELGLQDKGFFDNKIVVRTWTRPMTFVRYLSFCSVFHVSKLQGDFCRETILFALQNGEPKRTHLVERFFGRPKG